MPHYQENFRLRVIIVSLSWRRKEDTCCISPAIWSVRGDVAGLSNIGIGRVDGFPRLLKHHRSNAIRSCCRKRDFFILLGKKMRSRSLFKVVLVRSSPLLIRLSVPFCPVGLSCGGALSDVK